MAKLYAIRPGVVTVFPDRTPGREGAALDARSLLLAVASICLLVGGIGFLLLTLHDLVFPSDGADGLPGELPQGLFALGVGFYLWRFRKAGWEFHEADAVVRDRGPFFSRVAASFADIAAVRIQEVDAAGPAFQCLLVFHDSWERPPVALSMPVREKERLAIYEVEIIPRLRAMIGLEADAEPVETAPDWEAFATGKPFYTERAGQWVHSNGKEMALVLAMGAALSGLALWLWPDFPWLVPCIVAVLALFCFADVMLSPLRLAIDGVDERLTVTFLLFPKRVIPVGQVERVVFTRSQVSSSVVILAKDGSPIPVAMRFRWQKAAAIAGETVRLLRLK